MPGRQAHGRPVSGGGSNSNNKNKNKGKKRSKANALDAFSIASKMYEEKPKMTHRNRELDVPAEGPRRGKHARNDEEDGGDDEDDDDDDGEEDGGRPRKIRRGADSREKDEDGEDVEYGSDSSGNEWRVGVGDDDDESDIDSDDAFGESDEERFDGFTFRGSKKEADKDDDDEDDDADGASLGSDAIDLADALDMSMSEDEAGPDAQQDEDSEDESDASDSGSSDASSDVEDDEDDNVSESGLDAWVSKFSGVKDGDNEDDISTKTKPKINLKDLGLLTVKDPQLKKSVKLMGKEEKESTKKQKLDVPLARRQQSRLDRGVAYEKTNETLDRWTETVKKNRRAEHLVFPLPQTETGLSRHDNTELQPITSQSSGNELEQTILAIMEESGLGPIAKKETRKTQEGDEVAGEQTISRSDLKELWNKRRQDREAKSREEARAKRIRKIKSKAYHRVHRKQRERDEMKEREIMAATGEIDSEEEREAQDRQRAVERMGARHRESKWAKMRKGHAVWDDEVRAGITDMARRDEELRRRIEGRPSKSNGDDDDDDDESDYSDDNEVDERKRLLRQLDEASKADDSLPKSKLMSMAFMQKAEAAKKKANDEMIAEIRRELGSDDEGGSEAEPDDVGRRQFGQSGAGARKSAALKEQQPKKGKKGAIVDGTDLQDARDNISAAATNGRSKGLSAPTPQYITSESTAGAWSQPAETGPAKKQRGKKSSGSGADVLDFSLDAVAVAPAAAPSKPAKNKNKKQQQQKGIHPDDDDDEDTHLVQFREQELLDRAFGGLDVVADFEREKQEVAEEDDDKVIDNTLPGWGSWVGDGVSNREKKRHQGRFLTKQEGARKKDDRRDAKLKNVIINEKRIRKSEKYMASQLPHVYESKLQYERSLRLPIGPEFQTKETFQDATKPRVLLKQGIIAPMAKPTY